ncbi:MAG: hypothetical protein H7X71_02985, partial [Chitinophagales bacterium]|nr:hypothetical protein [Chitinophagales bacterium]
VPQIRNQFKITYIEASIINLALWNKFERCIHFYKAMENDIKNLKNLVSIQFTISVNYYLAASYFGLGKYHEALDHINIVIDHRKSDTYAMQTIPAQALFVMIHLELGNTEFVMNYLRTFKRYFAKQVADIKTITAIADIFKEYTGVAFQKNKLRAAAGKWLKRIEALKQDQNERIFLRNSMIGVWIKKMME